MTDETPLQNHLDAATPDKPPPTLSEGSVEERPPEDGAQAKPLTNEHEDPENAHRREMLKSKTKYAMWFTGSSVGALIILSAASYYWPGSGEATLMSSAIDTCKFLATTGFGYIIGKSGKEEP
ncbi:hypothetical protein JT358_11510 [Micrococcales bacterium 31B]|nr:hypothetical protein [Micrococcales bacterium 31B]